MTWKTMKTLLWSAIGGALVWWIVLGAVFGWMSAGSAEKLAAERSGAAVLDVLTPICVARFQQDTEKEAKLAALQQASFWSRDTFVTKQGWATMPGNAQPVDGVAKACASRILASNGS